MNAARDTLRLYVPDRDLDLHIARAWMRMEEAGDVDRAFTACARNLSTFMQMIQPPRGCLFTWTPEEGVWSMAWFEELLGCLHLGFWVHPSQRGCRGLQAWLDVVSYLFAYTTAPAILGVTSQPKLLDEHRRVGYAVHGPLPLWDGEPAWIVSLERAAFAATHARFRSGRRWLEHAGSRNGSVPPAMTRGGLD